MCIRDRYNIVSIKSEQTSFNSLKTIFVDAGAPLKSNRATFPQESHTILFHPCGSPTTLVSIPKGFPQFHPHAGLYKLVVINNSVECSFVKQGL